MTNMTNLNAGNKRKSGSKLSHIVENDFAVTVMTKWKEGLTILPNLTMYICWFCNLFASNFHFRSVLIFIQCLQWHVVALDGGGGIFICRCSQSTKTIGFKTNLMCRT